MMPIKSRHPFWAIWGLPLAFLVHDGEEAAYLAARGKGVIALFTRVQTTVAESIAGITFEFIVVLMVTLLTWQQVQRATAAARPRFVYVFAVLLAAWTFHGLVHLGGAIIERAYVMGAFTAIPACLGYGGWALYRLYRAGLVSRSWLVASPVIGIAAFVPLLGIAHEVGRLVG